MPRPTRPARKKPSRVQSNADAQSMSVSASPRPEAIPAREPEQPYPLVVPNRRLRTEAVPIEFIHGSSLHQKVLRECPEEVVSLDPGVGSLDPMVCLWLNPHSGLKATPVLQWYFLNTWSEMLGDKFSQADQLGLEDLLEGPKQETLSLDTLLHIIRQLKQHRYELFTPLHPLFRHISTTSTETLRESIEQITKA